MNSYNTIFGFDWLTYQSYFLSYILLSTAILVVKENKKATPENLSFVLFRQISTDICITLSYIIMLYLSSVPFLSPNSKQSITLIFYFALALGLSYIWQKNKPITSRLLTPLLWHPTNFILFFIFANFQFKLTGMLDGSVTSQIIWLLFSILFHIPTIMWIYMGSVVWHTSEEERKRLKENASLKSARSMIFLSYFIMLIPILIKFG